jgi:hypothetical protein
MWSEEETNRGGEQAVATILLLSLWLHLNGDKGIIYTVLVQ